MAALLIAASVNFVHAQAPQLTTEAVIGDAVSEANDARFSDVGEAIERFGNNDILGATTFLEAARQKNKNLPPVHLMLAKMHYLSGNPAAGQAALEQAVTKDPTDPEPFLILGEQAFQVGQTIVADALFHRAVELAKAYNENPKRKRNFEIRARAGRASIAERRDNWAQAEADLRAWLEVEPDSANAYERLGQVLFMQDKAADGYKSFVEAHKLNNKLPNPLTAAALMYDRLQKPAEAKQSFEKAYAENKTDETTLLAYAQWLIKQGDVPTAETILASAQKAAPKSHNVWLLSGVAAKMNGKPGPAEQFLMQALTLSPSNRDIYNQLALLLIDQPEPEKKAPHGSSRRSTSGCMRTIPMSA
jgi:Flp pilus assembly protein TadD